MRTAFVNTLVELAEARKAQVRNDVETITAHLADLGGEEGKLRDFVEHAREESGLRILLRYLARNQLGRRGNMR